MSKDIEQLIRDAGGTIVDMAALPDGSGFATAEFPLPKDHWLYQSGENVPPMPMRVGTDDPLREIVAEQIRQATRYAVRASTMNGRTDWDPDAVEQNMIVALLGYWTPDGLERA